MASPRPAPPEDDPLSFQLLNEIGIISQLAQNAGARLLGPDLNVSQFSVLNHFVRVGGEPSLKTLAENMQVTKGAMTNTVARLLDKGLVQVRPDPQDGRGKLVSISPAGRAARNRAVRLLGQGLAGLAPLLPADDLARTLQTLRRMRIWFDANR